MAQVDANESEKIATDLLTLLMNNAIELAKQAEGLDLDIVPAPKEHLTELLKAHWLCRISVELSLINNTLEAIRMRHHD